MATDGIPSLPRVDNAHNNVTGVAVKLDKDGNPKKKRKQLVACDSCRLRRVKCDKPDRGAADCSECAKKGINCTDTYVRSKPKIVRGGKLIQQAKQLYGGGQAGSNDDEPLRATGGSFASEDGAEDNERTHRSPMVINRASEGRMVDAELNCAFADHLVQTYLQVFQMQCHLVDWHLFSKNWADASRDASRMSPTNEILALAIQAWGARFSDHPIVIGTEPGAQGRPAPTLAEVRSNPSYDYTQYGNRRERFARNMVDRALDKMDRNAGWRTPSAACCSALLLLEFLLTWSNSIRDPGAGGSYMMQAVGQHLRAMNEPNTYRSDDPNEERLPPERVSGGTLLWMCYTRDALSAALAGRNYCLSGDDLALFSDLLAVQPDHDEVMASVSSLIPPLLSGLGVVSTFRHLTTAIRMCTVRVTGPLARRNRLDEAAVEQVWLEVDKSIQYAAVFQQSVERADWGPEPPKSDSWFRDLTVMQGQLTLAVHRALEDRLEREPATLQAMEQADARGFADYLARIRHFKQVSDRRLLDAGRATAAMLRSYGSDVHTRVTLGSEYIVVFTYHLMDMPVVEQGGPPGWTFLAKKTELQWLVDALKLTGWCWGGRDVVVEEARHVIDQTVATESHYRRSSNYDHHREMHRLSTSSPKANGRRPSVNAPFPSINTFFNPPPTTRAPSYHSGPLSPVSVLHPVPLYSPGAHASDTLPSFNDNGHPQVKGNGTGSVGPALHAHQGASSHVRGSHNGNTEFTDSHLAHNPAFNGGVSDESAVSKSLHHVSALPDQTGNVTSSRRSDDSA